MEMRLRYSLDLPIDKVWDKLKMVDTLHFVANPIVQFRPINPKVLPKEWDQGDYETYLTLFGWIPFGRHHIVIEIPEFEDEYTRVLIDNGYSAMIKTWRHSITLKKISDLETSYEDDVMIEAGLLTPFVWSFAWVFYRWRRRNWFKLSEAKR
jgi:hypothetical protein